MLIRGSTPASCFGLGGTDENAGTTALGWCMYQCPALRQEVLQLLGADPDLELTISSQVHGKADRGFTDLELMSGSRFHAILEAKHGWCVPTIEQLERYAPRLIESGAQHKRLISVSAATSEWAAHHQPARLGDIAVSHLSWTDLQNAAKRANGATRSPVERVWLSQLIDHLKAYGMTSNIFDARAYVVSLNRSRIKPEDPLTWVDVVVNQGRYFHPVGGNDRSGWPVIPPAYFGFRYHAEFRSVHFVESVMTVDRIQDIDPRWPETNTPNFVYTLGPPMVPAKPMPLGKIHPSMRNKVSLDLLLSGVASDYKAAIDMMGPRYKAQG
jgi:hypothetical protein